MIYKARYGMYYFLPLFAIITYIIFLILPSDSPFIQFGKVFYLLFMLFAILISVDILRGFKIANNIEKTTRERILKANRELFFTFVSAICVIHVTSLGIEYYNSKTIYFGRFRKYRNKDFFIPFEEIVKMKNKVGITFIYLKDGTNSYVSFDSNKCAMEKFIKIVEDKKKALAEN